MVLCFGFKTQEIGSNVGYGQEEEKNQAPYVEAFLHVAINSLAQPMML